MPTAFGRYIYDTEYHKKFYRLSEKYKKFYLSQGVGIFKADIIACKKAKRDLRKICKRPRKF